MSRLGWFNKRYAITKSKGKTYVKYKNTKDRFMLRNILNLEVHILDLVFLKV